MASEATQTLKIESDDESEELEVPVELIDMLSEEGESTPAVVADIALFGLAQRIHGAVHHGEGETDAELEAVEAKTMELFEDRFGMTFGEATGHSH